MENMKQCLINLYNIYIYMFIRHIVVLGSIIHMCISMALVQLKKHAPINYLLKMKRGNADNILLEFGLRLYVKIISKINASEIQKALEIQRSQFQ